MLRSLLESQPVSYTFIFPYLFVFISARAAFKFIFAKKAKQKKTKPWKLLPHVCTKVLQTSLVPLDN